MLHAVGRQPPSHLLIFGLESAVELHLRRNLAGGEFHVTVQCSWFPVRLLASLARDLYRSASEPAMARNTDASVTSYIKALNASMPPSGDPDVVANAFTENGVITA